MGRCGLRPQPEEKGLSRLRRRELVVFGLVGMGWLLTCCWALGVRLPHEADFAWKLGVNGPRLLLAEAVGAGLATSGAVGGAIVFVGVVVAAVCWRTGRYDPGWACRPWWAPSRRTAGGRVHVC